MTKASDQKLIYRALHDAADWQASLADAYAHIPNSPEREKALGLARRYHAMAKRLFPEASRPLNDALEAAQLVTIDEIRTAQRSSRPATPDTR